MTTIYSVRIKSQFNNGVVTQCREQDCELKLKKFPDATVIFNVDNVIPQPPEYSAKRCDRVIVADESGDVFFIPVEFKSTNFRLSYVKEQLEGGTRFFQNYLPNKSKFYPILVSKKITTRERRKLRSTKVISKYGEKRIKHIQCNKSLTWKEVN